MKREVIQNSVNTKDKRIPLEQPKDPVVQKTPSKEDMEIISFVKNRFSKMQSSRGALDKNWKIYEQQIESPFQAYSDGRSASNVPLERAIRDLYIAQAIKRKTIFDFKTTKGFEAQGKVFELLWEYDWSKFQRNKAMLENEYICATFGYSVYYTGFEIHNRIIEDFDNVSDEISFTRKLETKSQITLQNFDIRNFWWDERVQNDFDTAIDCITKRQVTWEEFRNLKYNKFYKNIDQLSANENGSDRFGYYITKEEQGKGQAEYVTIMSYWNKEMDRYIEIANDKVIIREHAIMNATHSLPFSVRKFYYNHNSITGAGFCEILLPFKSEINTLREMLMDGIKRSGQEVIAIGNGLEFTGTEFRYDNQIRKFDGQLGGNFQQINGTPPNAAAFNYMENLMRDVAKYSGIDIESILSSPGGTAFEAAVQKESSLQRVNTILINRDDALQRVANLHADNIMQYYPKGLVRELKILEKDAGTLPTKETELEISGETIENNRIIKKSGKNIINVSEIFGQDQEEIRQNIDINVYTNLNVPTINEVEKEQKLQLLNTISQFYEVVPGLEKKIPLEDLIIDIAKLHNIDTKIGGDETERQEGDELIEKTRADFEGITAPAQTGGEEVNLPPTPNVPQLGTTT